MITVSKCFEFDAAHRLKDHRGKCANIHGHRYRVEVEIGSVLELDETGIAVDFGDMKRDLGTWIDENFDHGFLVARDDTVVRDFVALNGFKCYLFEGPPTAENVALEISQVAAKIYSMVLSVSVWETPTSCATYLGPFK